MPITAVADLAALLGRYHLLDPSQLGEFAGLSANGAGPPDVARALVQRGWLTPYQANQLFQGRHEELLLGSYVLLEKLGEGGMGQVFKARNWKLGRVVALKLIRKERLVGEEAVRRFHREIRAASQLSHPNIVGALDADEAGGTHFFVMEYAEGTDLARLVKQHGALPVVQACDFIRQAAHGLQHAHERGMVHRDIKPHNLLLTRQGAVKILDMGLARLTAAGDDGEASTTVTREGAVMGTPDYMAPEQAEESHTVDVRADVYSLGCTLYHLLTGKVPFPGGTLIQKLDKHRRQEPVPVEQLRPEVPPAIAAVLRRMMAKRPADRYATPADLVRALESPAPPPSPPPSVVSRTGAARAPGAGVSPFTEDTVADGLNFLPTEETRVPKAERPPGGRGPRRALLGGGAVVILAIGLLAGLLLSRSRPEAKPGATEPAPQARKSPDTGKRGGKKTNPEDWARELRGKPPEVQVAEVHVELKRRNPRFAGPIKPTIEGGEVTGLEIVSNDLADLTPLRALTAVRKLTCRGADAYKGSIKDLAPLQGMQLEELNLNSNPLSDLRPLRGMPLRYLGLDCTKVSDLRPLTGMPLKVLDAQCTPLADLRPLEGMPLERLHLWWAPVTDLAPLRKLPLKWLNLGHSRVRSLDDLAETPLEVLYVPSTPIQDLTPLRGKKLTILAIDNTSVVDLSPIRGARLEVFNFSDSPVLDASVLQTMPLREVALSYRPERDAAVLRGIPTLQTINGKPAKEFWAVVDGDPAPKP